MLLAIDVGNTHTVYGLWGGGSWVDTWRRATDPSETEDEIGGWLLAMLARRGIAPVITGAICGSVVPAMADVLTILCGRYFSVGLQFLHSGVQVGLPVHYDPPHAVGADRIANALGALDHFAAPLIVVDFGTATTFDVIDATGAYVGGAILPGVQVSSEALAAKAAKLPRIEYVAPRAAIGRDTVSSLQSGVMFGYAGAIDTMARRIEAELDGDVTILATGGLGRIFMGLATSIQRYEPTLTLDGLVIAHSRISSS